VTHRNQCPRTEVSTTLALIVVAVLAAIAIAACGGSSPSKTQTEASAAPPPSSSQPYSKPGPTRQAHQTPSQSNPDVGQATSQGGGSSHTSPASNASTALGAKVQAPKHSDVVGTPHVQRAHGTPSHSNDDLNTTTPTLFNPCALVTLGEASSITGQRITQRIEAPLGPTCIYKASGSKRYVTLAVELVRLSQVTHAAGKRKQVEVNGLPAYCVHLGTQMLFVPLSGGRLLNVTAPCAVARQFAAVAVGRLEA
jgi:hypothetical protein